MQADAAIEPGTSAPTTDPVAAAWPMVAEPGLCDFALGNLQAVVKAGDIWARGFRLLNTALIGNVWMTIDDGICTLQARMSCRSLGPLLAHEADASRRTVSRSIRRFCVLARMAGQLGEDALVPLQRRVDAAFDSLTGRPCRS